MQKKETNKAPKDGQFLKQSWLFLFRNVGAVSNIPAPYVQADIPVSLGVCSLTSCTVSGAFFFHSHLQMSQTLFLYKRRIGNDCIGLGSFALLKCKLLKGKQNSVFSMPVLYWHGVSAPQTSGQSSGARWAPASQAGRKQSSHCSMALGSDSSVLLRSTRYMLVLIMC